MEPEDPILDPLVHLAFVAARDRADLARHRHHHPPAAQPAGAGQAGGDPRRAVERPPAARHRRRLPRAGDDGPSACRWPIAVPAPTSTSPPCAPSGPSRDAVAHHGRFVDFAGVDAHPRPVTARRAAHRRGRPHPRRVPAGRHQRPRLVRLRRSRRSRRPRASRACAAPPTRSSGPPSWATWS